MTVVLLDQAEWGVLHAQFLLQKGEARNRAHAMRAVDLLVPQTCAELLDALTALIGSPSRRVTASLLAKRIAFLTTASSLYAMSMYDKALDLSLENCYVDYHYANRRWQSGMPLENLTASVPQPGERAEWRRKVVAQLFAGNLSRLWQSLANVAKVPLPVLWENTAVRVYSLYERRMLDMDKENKCPHAQNRVREDFDYLVRDADAALFGTDENPLATFFRPKQHIQHTPHAAQPVRVRKTCCYYYKASEPQEYCSVCPLNRKS